MAVDIERLKEVFSESLRLYGMGDIYWRGETAYGVWNGEQAGVFLYRDAGDREDLMVFLDHRIARRAVAALEELSSEVLDLCERENVEVWEPLYFEAIVGSALLVKEAGVKLRMPLFREKKEEKHMLVWASTPPDGGSEFFLRPVVGGAEAVKKAWRIGGFSASRSVMPRYLFKYWCLVMSNDVEEERKGHVWVDGLSGRVSEAWGVLEEMDTDGDGTPPPEPMLDMDEARQRAIKGVLDLVSEEWEEVIHTGSSTVFKKIRSTPQADTLELVYLGLAYVPVWRVEGEKGVMVVDGVNGEVCEEIEWKKTEEKSSLL